MNGSEKWGFVWWATGNNAGRSVREFLRDAGCDDFTDYEKGGWRTHMQGVPKELEGCPVISNTRNPYDRAFWIIQTQDLAMCRTTGKEMGDEERRDRLKTLISRTDDRIFPGERGWSDDIFWKQFPLLNVYPDYYIRVESLEEDIKSIDCIMNNVDLKKVEESFDLNIRTNRYQQSEVDMFNLLTKWKQEYGKKGTRIWEHFYDQELADFVYEKWEDAFTLMGYDRDSWKQK